ADLCYKKKAIVLDTRAAQSFARGFIPGSVNIGLQGDFASWSGTLLKTVTTPILVVAEPGSEKEVIVRLSRVGFDQVLGYLKGGFEKWLQSGKDIDSIKSLTANEALPFIQKDNVFVVDARRASEYEKGHLAKAINIPLDYIHENKHLIPVDKTIYVYCAAGYRSMAFVSILRAEGYKNLIDIKGGFKAITDSGMYKDLLSETLIALTE
ncbi:MAG: MBL fold metallo-hydrolase, partial [Bacteroidia bacterium]|nr:MBL fold metallo-hydrolase [Bacteroidia bacterium]